MDVLDNLCSKKLSDVLLTIVTQIILLIKSILAMGILHNTMRIILRTVRIAKEGMDELMGYEFP